MTKSKKWIVGEADSGRVAEISQKFGISPLVAKIIYMRGIRDDRDIENFIKKDFSGFHNPFLLPDMEQAVEFILQTAQSGKKIAVYGDYDVDGITATYIVYDYLRSIGANVIYYIPDRAEEGYGINISAIDYLKKNNIEAIVTVDVGITAVDEIAYAKSLGIDVVVTDHHTLKETIPDCIAVINPKRADSKYPYDALAGVGVAYKLIYALSGCERQVVERYSDIAAIGTIADMVPLTGENRYIVDNGLNSLKSCSNTGLLALIDVASLSNREITASTVGYVIAPRLNAAGRIATATKSVRLLLETDREKAYEIAAELEEGNKQRQAEEQRILTRALEIINKNKLYNNDVIVVAEKGWHHGVIGIVSSRITEMFYKPSTVISINDDGTGKASGRSIKGFNLFDALNHCSEYLQKFGGHELAAGFTVFTEHLDKFTEAINQYAKKLITKDIATPILEIDDIINIEQINLQTVEDLQTLEPCGIGNKSPVFAINNAQIKNIRYLSGGKHAFITIERKNNKIEMPAFNLAEDVKDYVPGDKISVAGALGINTYKGVTYPQFLIRDIKLAKKFVMTKEMLSEIFRYIKHQVDNGFSYISYDNILTNKNLAKYGIHAFLLACKVYSELSIIAYNCDTNNGIINISIGKNYYSKNSLEDSPTYMAHSNDTDEQ